MSRGKADSTSLVGGRGVLTTDGGEGGLRVRRFVLRVLAGPDAGASFVLEGGTAMVGTHPHNDLVLTDPTVSRYHLEVQALAGGVKVTDLSTTNGTHLGTTRLGAVTLRDRAVLSVGGDTQLEVRPAHQDVSIEPFGRHFFGRAFGAAPAMVELFALLSRVAMSETTVLLQGETGTGKELLAEGVHQVSPRRRGPFVVVDCGAIPRELVAAELFGHVQGAFTGAHGPKRGLCDEADGGTLFLDEIGELPLELQPHLLRLLEKREVRPVGATRPHQVDLRVVAATNRDLRAEVRAGRFREDLYYRLAVVRVTVPALRERREEIPELVRLFLAEIGQGGFEVPGPMMDQLKAHTWPGNVRELRNVVERGLAIATSVHQAASIAPPTGLVPAPRAEDAQPAGQQGAPATLDDQMLDLPFKEAKGRLVEAFEREYLQRLLDRHAGNISQAAQEAGIDRNYIHRLVKRYAIDVRRG